MSRRMTRRKNGAVSLDSFLDIVTNTLGLLILIATLTVISSRDIKINLGRPLMREPDKDLERVCFECRGNRVLPVEVTPEGVELSDHVDSDQAVEAFNGRNVTNGFHRYELRRRRIELFNRSLTVPEIILHPLDHPVGSRISDLKREDSEFVSRTNRLNPKKHWVFFIVREDSFEALRVARAMLQARRFDVGWQPMASSTPITFSPFGYDPGPDGK